MKAIYEQIADDLRRAIEAATDGHQPGDPLPAMHKVADSYGTTPATVQRAFDILRTAGHIVRKGNGYVVQGPVPPLEQRAFPMRPPWQLDPWRSGLDDRSQEAHDPEVKVPPLREIPAYVIDAFNLRNPGEVVLRHRVHSVGGVPKQIADLYLPMGTARGTPLMAPTELSELEELARLGIDVARIEERVSGRPALETEVAALHLERHAWIEEITRTAFTRDGQPAVVLIATNAPGAIVRVYEWPLRKFHRPA